MTDEKTACDERSVPLIERWASEKSPIRILSSPEDAPFISYDDLPDEDE